MGQTFMAAHQVGGCPTFRTASDRLDRAADFEGSGLTGMFSRSGSVIMTLVVVIYVDFASFPKNILYHHVWFIGFMMLMIWRCHAWSWDWSRPAFIFFILLVDVGKNHALSAWQAVHQARTEGRWLDKLGTVVWKLRGFPLARCQCWSKPYEDTYIKQNKWHLAYLLSTLSLACWEMQLERPPWFEKKKRQVTNRRIMKCIVNKNDDWTGNGAFMKLPIVKKNRWNERSMRKKRKLPRRNFLNEQRFGHTLLREQIKSRCWIPPSTWPHYPLFCSFGWYGWTTRKCFFLCLCILVHIINHISISVLIFFIFYLTCGERWSNLTTIYS